MKRQNRFKKIKVKWPSFLDSFKEYVLKRSVPILAIFIFLAVLALTMKAFLQGSDYFRIRAVEAGPGRSSGELLKTYKGKNIFAVDIKGLSRSLEASYPDAKDISVVRVLPDKLLIRLKFRQPVAIINDAKGYSVDEEAFVLSNIDARYLGKLPVISGVDIRNQERKGVSARSKNLKAALALLREMKESKFFSEYSVVAIDAADIKDLSFSLKNGLEVKIGYENFKERLKLLKNTIRDPRLAVDRVEYIDVRFENAVIGPKE